MKKLLLLLLCVPLIGFGQINYYEDEGISFSYPSSYLLDSLTPTLRPQMMLTPKDSSSFHMLMIEDLSIIEVGLNGDENLKEIGEYWVSLLEKGYKDNEGDFVLFESKLDNHYATGEEYYFIDFHPTHTKTNYGTIEDSYYVPPGNNEVYIFKNEHRICIIILVISVGNQSDALIMILDSLVIKLPDECILGDCVNGYGTYTWDTGDKFVGEWKEDKFHGQGTLTWADGEKYVGEFKYGMQHGQGTMTYANGDKYIGEYQDDMKHGQGTYTFANGNYDEVLFENGEFISAKCFDKYGNEIDCE